MMTMVQINISIPKDWKLQLERSARIYSVEEDTNLSYTDLIRRAIQEKYDLKDSTDDNNTDCSI